MIEEHSITGGYEIPQAGEALGEVLRAPPDDHRWHRVQRMPPRAQVFHIAMIAGDDNQARGLVPAFEQAAKHRVEALQYRDAPRQCAAMTDLVGQPMRMKAEVILPRQPRQQASSFTRRVSWQVRQLEMLAPAVLSSIRRSKRAAP